MTLYFLHLHECGTVTIDEDGMELDGPEQAHAVAIRAAREMMCAELLEGRLCMSCYIDVSDAAGASCFKVQYRDAVDISG